MSATLLTTVAKSVSGQDSGLSRVVRQLPSLRTNVGSTERWLSAVAAGVVASRAQTGRGPSLGLGLTAGFLAYRAVTGNCPLYQALKVSTSDATAPQSVIAAGHGTRVDYAIRVKKPVADVYRFWRDFENFPRFMTHVLDVDTTSDGQSRWRVRGPLGLTVEWTAQLITDTLNETIAWKSIDGSDVDTAGSVHFREIASTAETDVHLSLKYDPPAGTVGTAVAKLFGFDPDKQVREDMTRFKHIIESPSPARTDTHNLRSR